MWSPVHVGQEDVIVTGATGHLLASELAAQLAQPRTGIYDETLPRHRSELLRKKSARRTGPYWVPVRGSFRERPRT